MYTLKFPFRLAAGQAVGDDEASTKIGDLALSVAKNGPYCVVTVQGFRSEDAAKGHIFRIWAGLMWLLLSRDLSPSAVLETQTVAYAPDPRKAAENLSKSFGLSIDGPVDGVIDGSRPAVYPTTKQPRTIMGGDATLTLITPRSSVLAGLAEGLAFPRSHQLIEDSKLRVAFELYGAYFTESSNNARFLTLVMALEALATGASRPPLVLALVDQWRTQVEGLLSNENLSPDELASLESLRKELLFRKEDSIRRQIYNLVFSTLQQAGDAEAEQLAKAAKALYDRRSQLVHEGKLPESTLSAAVTEAKGLVQRVLRIRFLAGVR
jgi:hypothetical protein